MFLHKILFSLKFALTNIRQNEILCISRCWCYMWWCSFMCIVLRGRSILNLVFDNWIFIWCWGSSYIHTAFSISYKVIIITHLFHFCNAHLQLFEALQNIIGCQTEQSFFTCNIFMTDWYATLLGWRDSNEMVLSGQKVSEIQISEYNPTCYLLLC